MNTDYERTQQFRNLKTLRSPIKTRSVTGSEIDEATNKMATKPTKSQFTGPPDLRNIDPTTGLPFADAMIEKEQFSDNDDNVSETASVHVAAVEQIVAEANKQLQEQTARKFDEIQKQHKKHIHELKTALEHQASTSNDQFSKMMEMMAKLAKSPAPAGKSARKQSTAKADGKSNPTKENASDAVESQKATSSTVRVDVKATDFTEIAKSDGSDSEHESQTENGQGDDEDSEAESEFDPQSCFKSSVMQSQTIIQTYDMFARCTKFETTTGSFPNFRSWYKKEFAPIANRANADEPTTVFRLRECLDKAAQAAYDVAVSYHGHDLKHIFDYLSDLFKPSKKLTLQAVYNHKMRQDESLVHYAMELQSMYKKVKPKATERETQKALAQIFRDGLPQELLDECPMLHTNPKTIKETLDIYKPYEERWRKRPTASAKPAVNAVQSNANAQPSTSYSNNRPNPSNRSNNRHRRSRQSSGGGSRDGRSRGRTDRSNRYCTYCKKNGHYARDCFQIMADASKRQENQRNNNDGRPRMHCTECGRNNHTTDRCFRIVGYPERRQRQRSNSQSSPSGSHRSNGAQNGRTYYNNNYHRSQPQNPGVQQNTVANVASTSNNLNGQVPIQNGGQPQTPPPNNGQSSQPTPQGGVATNGNNGNDAGRQRRGSASQ